mgnify:CR=1 FL=1|jgi:hypothetical protein
MKPYLFLLAFLMLFYASSAQKATEGRVRKYAVEFPYMEITKTIPVIKKKISTISGVSISGYCPTVKTIFFSSTDESYFNLLIAFKELELVYYIRPTEKDVAYCQEVGDVEIEIDSPNH